jgi:FlaA1/EpsC-like NDP-sugar epimerase
VTGAGGTIGSELSRQIAACAPLKLGLLDHSEYALFRIERELVTNHPSVAVEAMIGDVSRRTDMAAASARVRPSVLFHAAAYKHVTFSEQSIVPTVRTNVIGAFEAARAAKNSGARFVLISSDKAAQPRSVMGATKRMAELVALDQASAMFRPIAVRFGNVLGSSGSFVEIMAHCVEEGRNVPITHPDATRFFMTVEEAVSLVLKADLIGHAAEVLWLDMGKPLRIGDLAERFLSTMTPSGRTPVGIDVIGLRPGEKMREQIVGEGIGITSTNHPRVWSARQRPVRRDLVHSALRAMRRSVTTGDAAGALVALEKAVGDYTASSSAWSRTDCVSQ